MTFSARVAMASIVVVCLFTSAVHAAVVTVSFDASLTTGNLTGSEFSGEIAYDPTGGTGIGQEFFTLTDLSFTLLGTTFTKADIDQGGQMITLNGVPSYFTAAFFPPPPDNSPVQDIAFGFGGPGIIGYDQEGVSGGGTYVLRSAAVPEPTSLGLLAVGLIAMAVIGKATQASLVRI
jgi:hypothetical protein